MRVVVSPTTDGYSPPVQSEHLPLLERVLDPGGLTIRETGIVHESAKITFLVVHDITEKTIVAQDEVIGAERPGDERLAPFFSGWRAQRDALSPYIGQQLVYAGVWSAGTLHFLYIDPRTAAIVHRTTTRSPDPEEISDEDSDFPMDD